METEHRGRLRFIGPKFVLPETLALEVGLVESLVLLELDRQVEWARNHDTIRSRHEGRYWVRTSIRELAPTWGGLVRISRLGQAIRALERAGYILTRPAGERAGHKARWITVNYEACAAIYSNCDNPAHRQDEAITF